MTRPWPRTVWIWGWWASGSTPPSTCGRRTSRALSTGKRQRYLISAIFVICRQGVRSSRGREAFLRPRGSIPCTGQVCTTVQVIDQGGEPIKVQEYFGVGRTTEFRYCLSIADKVGNSKFGELAGIYDQGWGMADPGHAMVGCLYLLPPVPAPST